MDWNFVTISCKPCFWRIHKSKICIALWASEAKRKLIKIKNIEKKLGSIKDTGNTTLMKYPHTLFYEFNAISACSLMDYFVDKTDFFGQRDNEERQRDRVACARVARFLFLFVTVRCYAFHIFMLAIAQTFEFCYIFFVCNMQICIA